MKKKSVSTTTIWSSASNYMSNTILSVNQSKIFAGIIMILINIGTKFISIKFSKSCEIYLQNAINKHILIFAMAWLGTRDIYTAFILSTGFILLSDYFFNEESNMCVIPEKYRVLHTLIDTNSDGDLSDTEIAAAVAILEKAKREKIKLQQKQAVARFKEVEQANVAMMNGT